jgi:poly-gamma-glutamate synthesis protein (capsule biosynthesis protein)
LKCKFFVLLLFVLLISTCNTRPLPQETDLANIPEQEALPLRHELTLIAAGDNLFHITLINSYKKGDIVSGGDGYDYSPMYTEVKSLVTGADLAFINQESLMAGAAFPYSGYPQFNTPQSLAKTLAETGFDIINVANNHTMDIGRAGLYAALDLLEAMPEFTVLGARRSRPDAPALPDHRIITKNNITLGFLSYTYGLNGLSLPAGEPNLVSLINREKMTHDINTLRPLCDFLIVSMHWGDEYKLIEPVASQKDLAKFLAQHNVDLVIGHHPHVLQRVEQIKRHDGKEMLCFYSLGNFASNQREKEMILGGMMLVTFTKEEGELSISSWGLIPTVTHYDQGFLNTKVYPLYSYTEELLEKHHLRPIDKTMDFKFFNDVTSKLNVKLITSNPFSVR